MEKDTLAEQLSKFLEAYRSLKFQETVSMSMFCMNNKSKSHFCKLSLNMFCERVLHLFLNEPTFCSRKWLWYRNCWKEQRKRIESFCKFDTHCEKDHNFMIHVWYESAEFRQKIYSTYRSESCSHHMYSHQGKPFCEFKDYNVNDQDNEHFNQDICKRGTKPWKHGVYWKEILMAIRYSFLCSPDNYQLRDEKWSLNTFESVWAIFAKSLDSSNICC